VIPAPTASGHCVYVVRRAQVSDIEQIIRIAERVPTAPQWSCLAYSAYCAAERPVQSIQAKVLFVARAESFESPSGNILGFAAFSAVPHAAGGECELENMVVAEEWRRQGIGLRLLAAGTLWRRAWCAAPATADQAEAVSAPAGSGLWLEVRASNHSAIAFYEHAGFMVAGRRTSYYGQPTEDAVLMRKE
jgi:ribosomal protein S18 acetylase RimI-like enzyme